jgi:hypothetical protein
LAGTYTRTRIVDTTAAATKRNSRRIRTVCKGREGEAGKGKGRDVDVDVGMNLHLSIVVYMLGTYDIVFKKNKRIIMEDLKLK